MSYQNFKPNRNPYDDSTLPTRMIWTSLRLLIFSVVVLIFLAGLAVLYVNWQSANQGSQALLDEGSPDLSAAERVALQGYLLMQSQQLEEAAGPGITPVQFEIEGGTNANQVAINLSTQGVIDPGNESLFLNYLRYYGLDSQLEAGTYTLDPQNTIPQLADVLLSSFDNEIAIVFLEGWRMEQMANYIAEVRPAAIDPNLFLGLVQRTVPFDTSAWTHLNELESNQSLEGFLFPDTYQIATDTTAEQLLTLMLSNFEAQVTPAMLQSFGAQGLSVQEAVTIASIVEREAVRPDERPTIASVYLNRLAIPMRLEADPTVQYALGYGEAWGTWWKSPLSFDDLKVASPYNTYANEGIPPAPIANPGLGSLQAVAAPAQTDYLFFVAGCGDNVPAGGHLFGLDYDEHLANVELCYE